MEALSEPDHVNVPDSTRSPSDPSVVTVVAVTTVGTGSDGCDPCPLPPAADPLSAPVADDPPEISALDRNLAQYYRPVETSPISRYEYSYSYFGFAPGVTRGFELSRLHASRCSLT